MQSEEELQLYGKLRAGGFDPDECSTEEKIIYLWKLYIQSEDELASALERLELSDQKHAEEMGAIEAYVEQIKSLSDERETLTVEFEKENDALKIQIESEKAEIDDMLTQQGLEDIVNSSTPEKIAFLLVERAKLLDALENELNRTLKDDVSTLQYTGALAESSRISELHSEATDILGSQVDEMSYENLECCLELDEPSQKMETCPRCKDLQRERDDCSSKLIIAEEQLKSLERRIARYKNLLGGDLIQHDDTISQLQGELETQQALVQQLQESLDAAAATPRVLADFECESQGHLRDELAKLQVELTASIRSSSDLQAQCETLKGEVRALTESNTELSSKLQSQKEEASTQLEDVIVNYESKLQSLGEDSPMTESDQVQNELRAQIDDLTTNQLQLKQCIANQKEEIAQYQTELEEVLANQEEEIERNEILQQQVEETTRLLNQMQEEMGGSSEPTRTAEQLELLEKLSALTHDYELVMEKLDSLSIEHTELQDSHSSLKREYDALQQIQDVLKEDVETMMVEKDELMTEKKQLNQQNNAFQVADVIQEMSDLKESHEERMSSLNQSHATEITQLTNQKEENKKELTAAYQDKLESVQNILETAKVDRDHLSSLNKELEEKLYKQQSQLSSMQELVNERQNEVAEFKKKLQEVPSLQARLDHAEDELVLLRCDLTTAGNEIMEYKMKVRERDEQLGECQQNCDEFETELEAAKKELKRSESLTAESSELKARLLEAEEDNFRLAENLRQLTQSQDDVTIQLKELTEKHDNLSTRFIKLSTLNEELSTHNEDLTSRLMRSTTQFEELSAQYKQLMSEHKTLADLHRDLSSPDGNNKSTEPNAASEEDMRLDKYEADLLEKEETIKKLTQEQTEAVEQVETLLADLEKSQAKLNEAMDSHNLYKMEWESSLKDRDMRNAELTERIILLEKATNQLEGDNRELALKLKDALSQSEGTEFNSKHERAQLKATNHRLQDQVDRLKKYNDSLEAEMESLQDRLKSQTQLMHGGSEAKESEILSLKTEIGHIKLQHRKELDSLQDKLQDVLMENRLLQENLTARAEELSSLRMECLDIQKSLDDEKARRKHLESRSQLQEQENLKITERMREAANRKLEVEAENSRLVSELRSQNKTDALLKDTDSNKALELAETRAMSLEKQREELRSSLQQVTVELDRANQALSEFNETRHELQARKDEIIRLKSQMEEEKMKRVYEDRKVEDLKQSIEVSKQRELTTQEQNNQLKHTQLDLETQLRQLQNENASTKHELELLEGKKKSLLQKMSNLQQEKETLEIEIMAANEKLQLLARKYHDRKNKQRSKLRTSRSIHETEVAKLRDRIEYQERDSSFLKVTLEQEQSYKQQTEEKCTNLMDEKRQLIAKVVDLEDEIRERNRGIALLQTKLKFMDSENLHLKDMCQKLKLGTHYNIMDSLSQVKIKHSALPRDPLLSTFGGRTTSMESLFDTSQQTIHAET